MLWAMLYDHPVNTCYYLLEHLSSIGNKRADKKGEIVVGGIITYIARRFGMGENKGINMIEGTNKLDIDTLIAMHMIKPQPGRITFELKLSTPHILFVHPNPPRTDPEVAENLLYFGVNQQVQEDHGIDHEHEANEQFDAERWECMQATIQRISTEQQRQGVEISGLWHDVLRGNRINDENNQMLWNMMQHLHLQGPPYGPQ